MILIFKSVGEKCIAKNCRLISLVSAVSKIYEKLVNNRIIDHQEKCGLFSDL